MPSEFLVIFQYHEPEPFHQFEQGMLEEYESTTGIYIDAETENEAQKWAEAIASELLKHCNADVHLNWNQFKYSCWVEHHPDESPWSHCLDFFQHVRVGQLPVLDGMDSTAYLSWSASQPR